MSKKTFVEEVNINLKSPLEKQRCKEKAHDECKCNFQFFGAIDLYKNNNVHQETFVENLGLLNQNHFPIQFVERI